MGDDNTAVKQEKYDQKHLMLHTFKWDEFARNGVIKCDAVKKKDKDGKVTQVPKKVKYTSLERGAKELKEEAAA